jgi:hypothetical protein
MATGDAAQRYLENAMAAQMPALKQQQEGMQRYLQGQGQRVGAKGAAQQARKAVEGYATQAGQTAAKLGAESEKMGQQQEQFESQQEAWEKSFAEQQKQSNLTNLLNQYNATGVWTQEMLDAFGYDPTQQRDLERNLGDLGLTQGSGGGPGGEATGAASGPSRFSSKQNEMLFERAMSPGSQFATRSQRNQQAWLQSLFG